MEPPCGHLAFSPPPKTFANMCIIASGAPEPSSQASESSSQASEPSLKPQNQALKPQNPALKPQNPALKPQNPVVKPQNPALKPLQSNTKTAIARATGRPRTRRRYQSVANLILHRLMSSNHDSNMKYKNGHSSSHRASQNTPTVPIGSKFNSLSPHVTESRFQHEVQKRP